MFDYRGLEALYTIIEKQSFELAAKKLHITQSAVSQRVKGLEIYYREPLLIRMIPYTITPLGELLIAHYKKICLLEDSLDNQINSTKVKPHFSIALNRDSLETWFLELVKEVKIFKNITLEIIADDQELTLDYLKRGIVSGCVSTSSKPILGGQVSFLGHMEYFLVASPEFIKKYFSVGEVKKSLLTAPAIKFDKNDKLHERYLEKFFSLQNVELNFNTIPSVRGFKNFALLGLGYGLIPKMDIFHELKKRTLVQLFKGKTWKIPLYWHYWEIESKVYKQFNAEIIQYVTKILN